MISFYEHLDRLDSYFPQIEAFDNFLLLALLFGIFCYSLWRSNERKDSCRSGRGCESLGCGQVRVRQVDQEDREEGVGDKDSSEPEEV